MKKILGLIVVMMVILAVTSVAFAGGSLRSNNGYWDFRGVAKVVGSNVQVTVWNHSTDDSYGSSKCGAGMASCVVDVELWHSDAGRLATARVRFQDVCNGGTDRKIAIFNIPPKYTRLEVRFNVTTPNGRHSFQKGSTNWRK